MSNLLSNLRQQREIVWRRLVALVGGNPEQPTFTDENRGEADRLMGKVESIDSRIWSAEDEAERADTTAISGISGTRLTVLGGSLADQVRALGERLDWPTVVACGRSYAGAGAYEAFLRNAFMPDLQSVLTQLQGAASRVAVSEERDAEHAASEAERDLPDPLWDSMLEILSDAKARAERSNSTEARLERVEAALAQITERAR